MLTSLLRLLPTFVVGIPVAYVILRYYFRGSAFFTIGMIWVINLLFVTVNTTLAAKNPDSYPLYISTAVGIVVTAILLSYSGRLLRPLRQATAKLDQLSQGDLNIRLDETDAARNDEVGMVSRSIVRVC
jgi:methyl-accepting chemotaxis protein